MRRHKGGYGGGTRASTRLLMLYWRVLSCKSKLMTMMVRTSKDDTGADADSDADAVAAAAAADDDDGGDDDDTG